MCSISGFNWRDQSAILKMSNIVPERGPDDHGYYVDDKISLSHRRLSIIDLTKDAHQPMIDDKHERILVYNGEIYNHFEIKKVLESSGHSFRSKSDTEVILKAFNQWGIDCILRFNGIFAFALYDKWEGLLYLARDHIGIKPLYYYHDDNRLIFASTIQQLLVHDINTCPNERAIRDFLLYNITDHTSETFFDNISTFPIGHYAIFDIDNGSLTFKKWFDISFEEQPRKDYISSVKEFKKILTKAVNDQLISDVPVGTCLSGGIDSSTISCLINSSDRVKMKTFSAVFPGYEKDESKHIDTIIEKTKMRNAKVAPNAKTIVKDIEEFIRFMGEPVSSPSPYAQYKVFELCKKNNVTVLLNGQGADELLGGYDYFYGYYIKGLLKKKHFGCAIKEGLHLLSNGNKKAALSIPFLFLPDDLRASYFNRRSNIATELWAKYQNDDFATHFYRIGSLKEALDYHLNHKIAHLLKWEDRMSMAHSRESRVPFLDVNVIRFIFGLPEEYIISRGRTKSILRDAMDDIVPGSILRRKDKIGFFTPEDDWLRQKPMKQTLKDLFIENEPRISKYVDVDLTKRMITEHLSGKKNHGRTIWKSVFLEIWMKVFFNGSNG